MRIIVDVDCVVADLVGAILDIADSLTGQKTDRDKLILQWDWFEKEYPAPVMKEIVHNLDSQEFWRTLPYIKGAFKGVNYLREQGHQLIWVSKPREKCIGWVDARRDWLSIRF